MHPHACTLTPAPAHTHTHTQVLLEGTYPAVLLNLPRLPDPSFQEYMDAARNSNSTLTASALLNTTLGQGSSTLAAGTLRKKDSANSRKAGSHTQSVAGV